MFSLIAVWFASGSPAHAGRASACKAPPFSVPKETQRAVDAAIDARVVGTGAGAVSSGVETRTDYETTTLSQDAAARSWVEYTLCLKLAKKLISQELHDELLRGLLAPAPMERIIEAPTESVSAAASGPQPEPATPVRVPVDAAALVGTWQVTSTFRWSTCPAPNDVGGKVAYTWLLSLTSDQRLEARVVGTTSFPSLEGKLQGGDLLLQGELVRSPVDSPSILPTASGEDHVLYRPRVFVTATTDGVTMEGTRDVVMIAGPVAKAGSSGDPANQYELCMVRNDIVGHR